jgi:hypothetical protein
VIVVAVPLDMDEAHFGRGETPAYGVDHAHDWAAGAASASDVVAQLASSRPTPSPMHGGVDEIRRIVPGRLASDL